MKIPFEIKQVFVFSSSLTCHLPFKAYLIILFLINYNTVFIFSISYTNY